MQRYFSYICGGLKKKLNLRSGSQCQRHFVGFSLQAPCDPFYCYFEKPPHLFVFYDTLGIRRTYSHLKAPGSPRGDYFIFHITNFPFLNMNIPLSSDYGIFSQFIWYARACSSNIFDCFTLRPCHFSIICAQGYVMKHLESSFGKYNDTGILFNNIKFPSREC